MEDPKPELSLAALKCNQDYWEAKAKEALKEAANAYKKQSDCMDYREKLSK